MGLLPDTWNCGLRMRLECRPPLTSKETASYRFRHVSRHVRHASAVMHVKIAEPRWRGKRSRHSRWPQFYVSGKRPVLSLLYIFVSRYILDASTCHGPINRGLKWTVRNDPPRRITSWYKAGRNLYRLPLPLSAEKYLRTIQMLRLCVNYIFDFRCVM